MGSFSHEVIVSQIVGNMARRTLLVVQRGPFCRFLWKGRLNCQGRMGDKVFDTDCCSPNQEAHHGH